MTERPTAAELVEAVREFLENDVMTSTDKRLAFQARVASNALGIVERDLQHGVANEAAEHASIVAVLGHDGELNSLRVELAAAIRSGRLDDDRAQLLATLTATAKNSLAVANPKYVDEEAVAGE